MRILLISPGLGLGGAERWVLSLIKYLKRSKVVGIFFSRNDMFYAPYVRELRELGVPSLLPTEVVECDAVVTWGTASVRRLLGPMTLPIVEVAHGGPDLATQREYQEVLAWQATHWVAVSESGKEAYPESYRDRVVVLENGVDPDRLQPRFPEGHLRHLWRIGPDEKIVLFLGRLAEVKQPDLLLRAVKHLGAGWVPVFVGDGPMKRDLVTLARKGDRKVVFQSPLECVGDLLGTADVLCIPSKTEACSLAMLEAWHVGLPVAGTRYHSAIEYQAKYGPVIELANEAGTPRSLAKAIRRACGKDVRETQKLARRHFSGTAFGERWDNYLENVVAPSSRGGAECRLTG